MRPKRKVYGPSQAVTQVGEQLLALVQQLGEEINAISVGGNGGVSTYVDEDLSLLVREEWRGIAEDVGIDLVDYESVLEGLREGYHGDEPFALLWVSTVARALAASMLGGMSRIPHLSDLGAEQLVEDIAYFENVLSALGISAPGFSHSYRHSQSAVERNFPPSPTQFQQRARM